MAVFVSKRVLLDRTDDLGVQFLRYTIVGGVAFMVDFAVLVLVTEMLPVHYLFSAALGFTMGLATNYLLSTAWVFNRRTLASRWLEFLCFGIIGVVGLGINELLMWCLTELAGCHYAWSKVGATVFVYVWNFSARRFLLFR